MDAWNRLGLTNNSRGQQSFSNGFLYVQGKNSITKTQFKYAEIKNEFEIADNGFSVNVFPTRTIYTNYTWLSFANGARVLLQDGSEHTVLTVTPDIDPKRAYMTGNGIKGITIVLKAG